MKIGINVGVAMSNGTYPAIYNRYLGGASTANRMNLGGTSANKQSLSKTRHYARTNIGGDLQIRYPNWYMETNWTETGPGGTASIEAAIEYPIGVTITRVTWGGANAVSVATLTNSDWSDPIAVYIPQGEAYIVRTFVNSTSSTVFELRVTGNGDILDVANGEEYRNAVSGMTNQIMNLGAFTSGSNAATRRFGPIAQRCSTTRASVGVIGDSREYGINDYFTGLSGDRGQVSRALGANYAYSSMGKNGQTLANFLVSNALQVEALSHCSDIIIELGINDLITGGKTPAQVATSYASVAALFPGKNLWLTTLPPSSTSTDSFSSIANQTTASLNANRVTINTASLAGRTGYKGCFDFNAVAEDAAMVGKWKVSPFGRTVTDAAGNSGSPNLSSATANFTSSDTGGVVVCAALGWTTTLRRTMTVVDSTNATMSANATASLTGQTAYINAAKNTDDGVHETQYQNLLYASSNVISATAITR